MNCTRFLQRYKTLISGIFITQLSNIDKAASQQLKPNDFNLATSRQKTTQEHSVMLSVMLFFSFVSPFVFYQLFEHFQLRYALSMSAYLPTFFIILHPAHIFSAFPCPFTVAQFVTFSLYIICDYFVQSNNRETLSFIFRRSNMRILK